MLFNSFQFIVLFLPIVVICYFWLNKYRFIVAAKAFLIISSLFFYGYWNPKYVFIILLSVIFNFSIGSILNIDFSKRKKNVISKKYILGFGILVNLCVLGYYKYADFFIQNINRVFHLDINLLHIVLPLAISFFTFQQISYLVDSYKGETREYDFLNYTLFVTFFPQLIAGPIVRHCEVIPQFQMAKTKVFNPKNFSAGLFLFIVGLSKKVIIADTVATWATAGYNNAANLTIIEAWLVMLSYTFQIYYDFSGYTDMALGIGKMFNIRLPQNFNNPYQALSIEDFWRKWHISLSRFLKDYLYIPICKNFPRTAKWVNYVAVMIVFFVSGLWHGASWLFVIWGISHGIINVINKFSREHNVNINKVLSWLLTFIYLNLTWVFFRSENLTMVKNMFKSAFGQNGFSIPKFYGVKVYFTDINSEYNILFLILLFILIVSVFFPLLRFLVDKFRPNKIYICISVLLLLTSLLIMSKPNRVSPFIYFNF